MHEAQNALGPYISSTILYCGWAAQLVLFDLFRGTGERRQTAEEAPAVAA